MIQIVGFLDIHPQQQVTRGDTCALGAVAGSQGGFSGTSQMDTALIEGPRETPCAPGGERCGCFAGDSAFEGIHSVFIPSKLCNGAQRRARELKTPQRDTESFFQDSVLCQVHSRTQQSREIPQESIKITVNQGGSLNLSFQRRQ